MLRNSQVVISEPVGHEVPGVVAVLSEWVQCHLYSAFEYIENALYKCYISYRFSNKVSNITTFLCSLKVCCPWRVFRFP